MVAGNANLVIEKGEDWTVQIQCLDDFDQPKPLKAPCRMDIVDLYNTVLFSLVTNTDDADPDVIPTIGVSGSVGTIQLHIPHTVTDLFPPQVYYYDLYVTVDGGDYAGDQITKELEGQVIVKSRKTESF